MSYQANEPGTQLSPEELIILSELANLGNPGDVWTVNPSGTAAEFLPPTGGSGEFLEAGPYDKFAVGGILISSHYIV